MEEKFRDFGEYVEVYDFAAVEEAVYGDDPKLPGFELVQSERGGIFESRPDEYYYQGIHCMVVIRRVQDGQLFGKEYFNVVSKHGEPYFESDDEDDDGRSVFTFERVKPFTIEGYTHA